MNFCHSCIYPDGRIHFCAERLGLRSILRKITKMPSAEYSSIYDVCNTVDRAGSHRAISMSEEHFPYSIEPTLSQEDWSSVFSPVTWKHAEHDERLMWAMLYDKLQPEAVI